MCPWAPSADRRGHGTGSVKGGALKLLEVFAVEIGAVDVGDDGLADGVFGGVPRHDARTCAHDVGFVGGRCGRGASWFGLVINVELIRD